MYGMMQGFEWCESRDGVPVLAWCFGSSHGYAFRQRGDGSSGISHTTLQKKAGSGSFTVDDPGEDIEVPQEMLAWAGSIMGGEGRVTLGFASGMVNSGVGPDCFLHERRPSDADSPPATPPPRPSRTVLGGGSWTF